MNESETLLQAPQSVDCPPLTEALEPLGFRQAMERVAAGRDIDYVTYHGLTHREVIQSYVGRRYGAGR